MNKTIQRNDITLDAAMPMAQAAVEKAKKEQCYVSVVVMDSAADIKVCLRMDKAGDFSVKASEQKAYSALLGLSTKDLGVALRSGTDEVRDSLLNVAKITLLPGGYPIMVDGEMVGALAVGGGTTEQDEACALCALDVLNSL